MLGNILFRHHTPYSLIIDIGSGSVGVALIDAKPEIDVPHIIYTHRERIRTTKKKTPEEFVRTLREALLAATLELSGSGMQRLAEYDREGRIEHVYVLYASPWSNVITRIIALEHKEVFKTTESFVDTLIADALKTTSANEHEEAIFAMTGQSVIHHAIIDSKVNGYPVTHFVGQEATELHIAYMTELVPQTVRDTLEEAEKNISAHAPISERTFVRGTYATARKVYPDHQSMLLLETTGEATECAIVERGILYENFTTLFGSNSFYRLLAAKLGTLEEEAVAHVRDYEAQIAHEEVKEIVTMARETYKEHLRQLFEQVHTSYPMPKHVVVVLHPETAGFFSPMITEAYAMFRSDFELHHLDNSVLDTLVSYEDGVEHDQYLAIASFFFHTEERHTAEKQA